ncbi:MAG TPA: hypothetical protein VF221_00280 [Chloroflexota bacterium]
MKSERGRNLVSYQSVLRTVGAYLDEYAASQVTVLETPDSFAIRLKRPGVSGAPTLIELSYDDLVSRTSSLTRRRGRGAMRAASPHVLTHGTSRLETFYQDLFRALGWELDDTSAYNILLEEVNATFLVTYMTLDRDNGYIWRKRNAQLGIGELDTVLKEAQGRRQPPPLQRRKVVTTVRPQA